MVYRPTWKSVSVHVMISVLLLLVEPAVAKQRNVYDCCQCELILSRTWWWSYLVQLVKWNQCWKTSLMSDHPYFKTTFVVVGALLRCRVIDPSPRPLFTDSSVVFCQGCHCMASYMIYNVCIGQWSKLPWLQCVWSTFDYSHLQAVLLILPLN